MKIVVAILFTVLLALTVYAADMNVTAKVTQFLGGDGSVEVTLKNTAVMVSVPMRVIVDCIVNNTVETYASMPFEAVLAHPMLVNGFKLELELPWVQISEPDPFTLLDGESKTFTLDFAKIAIDYYPN